MPSVAESNCKEQGTKKYQVKNCNKLLLLKNKINNRRN